MKRFWVVHNIPAPYRLHIFDAFWRECRALGLDFHVHFMSDMSRGCANRPLSWRNPKMEFPHTYWRDCSPLGARHFNPGLLAHLWREQPEFLLAGSPFDTLTGMLAGRLTRGVTCTWCEGNTKTPGRMGFPLGWVKRFALGGFDFVAVPGRDAVRYIALHQARTSRPMPRPVLLPNLVDETRFTVGDAAETMGEGRKAIIPARLVPVKGLIPFLSLLTPEMLAGWKVEIVGEGPLKGEILDLIRVRGLGAFVDVVPFVPYDEMPRRYREADVLILPSLYDPNPLSVVEALHSGLAVALSSEAGNVEEAVTHGRNGWVLPVRDEAGFRAALARVFATDKATLREMGARSKAENAAFWDTKRAVKAFLDEILHRVQK